MENIIRFCNLFYNCHPYPLHYYHDGSLIWEQPLPPVDFLGPYLETLLHPDDEISTYQSDMNLIFGTVCTINFADKLVIGPIPATPLNYDSIRDIMKGYQIPSESKNDVIRYLGNISGFSIPHLRNLLALVHLYLNPDIRNADDALLNPNAEFHEAVSRQQLEYNVDEQNYISYRDAFRYEQALCSLVRNGDVKGIMNHAYPTSPQMHVGKLAYSSLRQVKNIFICTTTMATRAAMEGGLDPDTAYQLSDIYIRQAEDAQDLASLQKLVDTMLIDFTQRTCDTKVPSNMPVDIYACLQYIRQNTHIPLTVENVASFAHLSRSQLNRRFKNTLGFHPGEFILRCRLEEAKELLSNTGKSIGEISQILCFSSAAHFSTAFRRQYGYTPGEFRSKPSKT